MQYDQTELESTSTSRNRVSRLATNMPEVLLHYSGLAPGQSSWFKNRRGHHVALNPGEWVRVDLTRHPEVLPAIQAGTAIITTQTPPLDAEILDEGSSADRGANPYGKRFPEEIPKRRRSRGRAEVRALNIDQLELAARRFCPWPSWQSDVESRFGFSEARSHDRGAQPSINLPLLFDRNFAVLHRIAELIAQRLIDAKRVARNREINAGWDSGEYETKAECRSAYERRYPLPTRRHLVGDVLQRWGIWKRASAPSSRTLRRYRTALGTDRPVRAYADEQILEVLRTPCQRIILGPGEIQIGAYVPGRAAAPALTAVGPTLGCVVLDVTPPADTLPSSIE